VRNSVEKRVIIALQAAAAVAGSVVCVVKIEIPTKAGTWRYREMTPQRARRWHKAFASWWMHKGKRLAHSPEMWQ
jgi:hypothetical protein